MLIGLTKDKTPIDFWLTRSKVKVTWVTCKNKIKRFPLIILRIIFHRAFKFHMLIRLDEEMNSIDFGFTRSTVKVTRVLFVKQWFPLIERNIYHRAVIFHMLLGHGDAMTPYDF